ncbi:MAG: response regulator [Silicimonas sp.]|nr:response regulator [Silicimonas sp.]NNL34718.1 response regulator [Silicimonas sp.]NNL73024.1 response regulator [Silicimonas sp.]
MILIVSSNRNLARIWAKHLERQGNAVMVRTSASDAVDYARMNVIEVVVLDLMLEKCSAFSVADYISYRHPHARVVFVTRTSFFSDGSLFRHVPNTAAIVQEDTPPSDLAEIVAYHGRAC